MAPSKATLAWAEAHAARTGALPCKPLVRRITEAELAADEAKHGFRAKSLVRSPWHVELWCRPGRVRGISFVFRTHGEAFAFAERIAIQRGEGVT